MVCGHVFRPIAGPPCDAFQVGIGKAAPRRGWQPEMEPSFLQLKVVFANKRITLRNII
jgi:hypothetical protein